MVIRVPLVAGVLGMLFAFRFVARRLDRRLIKLPRGGRVKLLSSIGVGDGHSCRMLALEYVSAQFDPDADELEDEALELLRVTSGRPDLAGCTEATVTVRLSHEDANARVPAERVLSFRRFDPSAGWYAIRQPG
jgi:hypothetical protein